MIMTNGMHKAGLPLALLAFYLSTTPVTGDVSLDKLLNPETLRMIYSIYTQYRTTLKCRYLHCKPWDAGIIAGLAQDIEDQFFGHNHVQKAVIGYIKGHILSKNPGKALALSFHGPTGVGKTYLASIIARNMLPVGEGDVCLQFMSATKDFHNVQDIPHYKEMLISSIRSTIWSCPYSIFIFDEADMIPIDLLNAIKPYLDYYDNVDGVDYRKAIFIFLSNAGAEALNTLAYDHLKAGKKREDLRLKDAESCIIEAIENNPTGFSESQLFKSNVISAYIPFFPLEEHHVRMCIKAELVTGGFYQRPDAVPEDVVNEVMEELTFWPKDERIFSKYGCKRVEDKVRLVMFTKRHEEL